MTSPKKLILVFLFFVIFAVVDNLKSIAVYVLCNEVFEDTNHGKHYIHQNPVRVGIVTESSFYTYSSACLDSPLKITSI